MLPLYFTLTMGAASRVMGLLGGWSGRTNVTPGATMEWVTG
jgi:hypothetical protein